ncbi:MAG: hypothetical protein WCV89_02005 [Candidatus Paceibacterota bacterium]
MNGTAISEVIDFEEIADSDLVVQLVRCITLQCHFDKLSFRRDWNKDLPVFRMFLEFITCWWAERPVPSLKPSLLFLDNLPPILFAFQFCSSHENLLNK